jgi:nucleoside-diphosphate-sugar epimerase
MPESGSAGESLVPSTPPAEAGVADAASRYEGRAVAITGAAGFIGTLLRRQLIAAGASVHAVSRRPQPPDDPAGRWWELDVRTPGALDELVRTVEPEVLFHLAGETSAARELDLVQPTFAANVAATVNVLTSVAASSPSTRVVIAGSLEEPPPGGSATASSPYALSKATATAYGLLFHELYRTRVVNLRVFMTYGPGQSAVQKLVPYVTLALLKGEPAVVSSGRRLVDWIYVDDVARAFLAAGLAGPTADGQSFDVGSGQLVSVRAVAEEIAAIVGCGEVRFGERTDRAREQEPVADPEPAASILGWRAATPLSEGLRRTVEWYRAYGATSSFRP